MFKDNLKLVLDSRVRKSIENGENRKLRGKVLGGGRWTVKEVRAWVSVSNTFHRWYFL